MFRSFKSKENIHKTKVGPYRGFGYLGLISDPSNLVKGARGKFNEAVDSKTEISRKIPKYFKIFQFQYFKLPQMKILSMVIHVLLCFFKTFQFQYFKPPQMKILSMVIHVLLCFFLSPIKHQNHSSVHQTPATMFNERTNGLVNAHLIYWPSKAQNI